MIAREGPAFVFGIQEICPLRGFPEGRARVRMRVGEVARVFIKTTDGILCYIPKAVEGFWEPFCLQSINQTLIASDTGRKSAESASD